MDPTSGVGSNPIPLDHPSRSHLLTHNFRNFISKRNLLHPEKNFTEQLYRAERRASGMDTERSMASGARRGDSLHEKTPCKPKDSQTGEHFEPRQTFTSDDYTPHPERSLKLSRNRQELVDDIIALYSCQPTVERVKRYTPDCVYDDQFVHANNRYKMARQWFALPRLFKKSVNEGYEVVKSNDEMIQLKSKQSWTFRYLSLPTATITGLVTLVLDPATLNSDFMQIKYHIDYSHEGVGFSFKKWQADNVVKHMDASELKEFEKDQGAGNDEVISYGTGKKEDMAPKKNLTWSV